MKKVVFVVNDEWFFCSHRLPVAVAAIKAGYEVVLIARLDHTDPVVRETGVITRQWNIKPKSRFALDEIRAFVDVYRILREEKPDIIHLVTIKAFLYGGVASRILGIASQVVAISGLGRIFTAKGIKAAVVRLPVELMYRLLLWHKNSTVIVQNNEDKSVISALNTRSRSTVVKFPGSGVDLSSFYPASNKPGEKLVLFASRLLYEKGVLQFVEIARRVKKQRPGVRFAIVGSPDTENPGSVTEEELRDWEAEGCVEVWGHRSDMPVVMREADMFIFPTRYGEGVPKVLIEACASGLVVIASNHPGCRELITDGDTGFVVDPLDLDRMAMLVVEVIDDPVLADRIAGNARRNVEHGWSVDIVVKETLSIYSELSSIR